MSTETIRKLKRNLVEICGCVEEIAAEENTLPLEVISRLQSAAATTGNDELLDRLCELKRAYVAAYLGE
jgi:hypothetical protein